MSIGRIETVDETKQYVEYAGFGGTECISDSRVGNVKDLSLEKNIENLTLTWKDPDNVVFDGKIIGEWAGTKVVKKEGSAPTSVEDGELIADNTIKDKYATDGLQDSDVVANTQYNYALFPYTTKNIYTLSDSNRVSGNPPGNLQDMSWAEISEISASGRADKMLKIHDTKDGFKIVGFNHDIRSDGTKAGVTFVCNDINKTINSAWYSSINANIYFYNQSVAYTALNNFFTNSFPDEELKAVIKPVRKYYKNSSLQGSTGSTAANGSVTSSYLNLWLFAYAELFQAGQDSNLFVREGELYENFPLEFSEAWWTRSWTYAYSTSGRKIFKVEENGTLGNIEQRNSLALRYGFCI